MNMIRLSIFVCLFFLVFTLVPSLAVAGGPKKSSEEIHTYQIVGRIIAIDLKESSVDLEYVADDQSLQMKSSTFYVTDATQIDIATVKKTLADLTVGSNILVEYAQMPDGQKVVDSIWVKKS